MKIFYGKQLRKTMYKGWVMLQIFAILIYAILIYSNMHNVIKGTHCKINNMLIYKSTIYVHSYWINTNEITFIKCVLNIMFAMLLLRYYCFHYS